MNAVGHLAGRIFASVILLFCVGANAAWADTINLDKLEKQIRRPSVQIADPDHRPMCSGTIVVSKRDEKTGLVKTGILTAQHCVKESPYRNYDVRIPSWDKTGQAIRYDTYVATVAKQGTDTNDMAILVLKDTDTSFADRVVIVGAKDLTPRFGEQVWASGYPLARDLSVTEGRFDSREDYNFPDDAKETSFFRASASIAPGNSGGGLYHLNANGDFELIGVTDWKVGQEPGTFGAYTPIDRVSEFITSWMK